jgi:hypothetical protein
MGIYGDEPFRIPKVTLQDSELQKILIEDEPFRIPKVT